MPTMSPAPNRPGSPLPISVTIRATPGHWAVLQLVAEQNDESISAAARRMIESYAERLVDDDGRSLADFVIRSTRDVTPDPQWVERHADDKD
jgi:hypothetical protein